MFVPLSFQKHVHTHQQLKLIANVGAQKDLQYVYSLEHFFLKKIMDSLIAFEYKNIKIILQLLES